MLWCRFYVNIEEVKEDYRPVVWPIKYPYWCSGETEKDFILVAYVESLDELYKQWPEAKNIDSEEVKKIEFSSRFPKPDWYTEEKKEKKSKREKFIEKFGHWWYIRDLDFLPQPCEDYMKAFKMDGKWLDLVNKGGWKAFNNLEEARKASNAIRKIMGMEEYKF